MKRIIIELIIVTSLLSVITIMFSKINNLKENLDYAQNNVKAYSSLNDSLMQNSRVFSLKIEELSYLNDSIFNEMKNVSDRLKIRENQIKQLQYIKDEYNKTDTVFIRDTIFNDPSFELDTMIGDEWGKTRLELKYPNEIIVGHSYVNKKHIVFSSKKEYVKQRKWFLPKLFTRKRIYVEATVIDENPYVETKESRFVECIE